MKQLIALVFIASLGPAAQEKTPRLIRSFQDTTPRNLKSELEILVQEHQVMPAGEAKAVTSAQALQRLRDVVDKKSTPEARAALAGAPLAKTPRGLTAMAAAAVLSDNRTAALAALLRAVEKWPADVDARVNLAGVAASLGFASETLALLDGIDEKAVSSSSMGAPGRSVVLAIRGHALVHQRRYREAREALRQAVAPAPYLSEAGQNLALALQQLGEREEAQRAFYMAAWRGPVNKMVCGGGDRPLTGDPFKDAFQDDVTSRPAASQILDLSRGVVGTLPKIPHAVNLEQFGEVAKWAEKEFPKITERLQAHQKEFLSLAEKVGARPQNLSEKRARAIQSLIAAAHEEPELRSVWLPLENREELTKKVGKILEDGQKEFLEIVQARLEEKELKRRINALSDKQIGQINPLAKKFDRLARDWWAPAHKHKTGLVTNLKDQEWHDLGMAEIRMEADSFYAGISAEMFGWYAGCTFDNATLKQPAEGEDPQKAVVPGCSGAARQFEVELKITDAFTFSVNCEKVGLELAADVFPGLGGYAKLEIETDGISIHAGPKGELSIPGLGQSVTVKDGLYIEVGREGIRDAGFEVSFETGNNATPGTKLTQTIDSMKFSFMPTPGR